MERLIVKNFGPLKDVDIELNRINLFIGENGSGKSVLAKIVTIISSYNIKTEKDFFKQIKYFQIDYITDDTVIKFFLDEKKIFELRKKSILIKSKLEIRLDNLVDEENKIKKNLLKDNKYIEKANQILKEIQTSKKFLKETIEKKFDKFLISQYIPAERSLISLFNKSLSTLILEDVPLPKFLLRFSSEFEKAGNDLKELEFLNVKYINGDGLDRHKVYFNDKDYLPLELSSSGIQSALPLYLTIKYFVQNSESIIIEEPEQNLFPKAQAETVKYIIEQVSDVNNLFMMTHSPYVLSTLNNLIMAYKVAQMSKDTKERVKEFIKEEQWINPNEFSAYYLEDGIAKNIVSKRGLISDNEIDDISEEITGEFDDLMQIYREFKYAK